MKSATHMKAAPIRRPGLYAISPDRPLASYAERLQALLGEGLSMVQYRRKDAPLETRSEEAKTILAWCREVACPLLINDDVALAQIVGADGVHLGRDDTDLGSARQQLGAAALIGVSCYDDLQRAQRLRQQGADYVAFGRFFPSQSKPHATPAPLALLQAARQTLDCPIVAIGGITRERVPALQQAGADLCAMIEGLFGP